jgi:hypothetical protein
MQVRWKKLFVQSIIWVAAEVLLTVAGLDDLADYSEFVFEKHASSSMIRFETIV